MTDAQERFTACLNHVLAFEGGYVDHPSDLGGATNMGITRKTLAAWRKVEPWQNLPKSAVQTLGRDEAAAIYDAHYWSRVRGADLPPGLDLVVFDYAVNSGPGRAVKMLQKLVGAAQDGVVGPRTLAALADGDPHELIARLCKARLGFLGALSTFPIFGRGWTRRVSAVLELANVMAGPAKTHPKPQTETPMQALSGYRTYIIAAMMLLAGLCQAIGIDLPSFDSQSAGQLVMEALAVIFLRRGVSAESARG